MKKTLKNIDLNLISVLILNFLVLIMGLVVIIFKSFGLIDIVLYISILFYIYALFSTACYFVKRKEGDYETLLLALINIIVATFMFIFKNENAPMILGTGLTIYTVLLIINRICKIIYLKNKNSFVWIIKSLITFLITFLGILTIFNLFKEVTVQTMMFGFYFMSLGFMLILENVIEIFVSDSTFRKILSKLLDDPNKTLEEIKEDTIDLTSGTTKSLKEIKKEEKPTAQKKVVKKDTKKETKPKIEVKTKEEIKKSSSKTKESVKKVTKANESKKEVKPTPKKVGRPKKTESSK